MSLVMGPNSCPGIGLSLTHPRWQKWDRPHQWLYLPRQCPVWKSYTGPKQLTPLLCLEVNSYPWKRKEAHSFQHRVLVGPRTFFFFFLWSCSMCFFLLKQKPRSAVVVCYIWVFFFLFFFSWMQAIFRFFLITPFHSGFVILLGVSQESHKHPARPQQHL